jgi:hypothetical protein
MKRLFFSHRPTRQDADAVDSLIRQFYEHHARYFSGESLSVVFPDTSNEVEVFLKKYIGDRLISPTVYDTTIATFD